MSCACRVIADHRHTTSGFPCLYSWFNPDFKIAHFLNIGAKEVCNMSILNLVHSQKREGGESSRITQSQLAWSRVCIMCIH